MIMSSSPQPIKQVKSEGTGPIKKLETLAPSGIIERSGNTIFFYSDINPQSTLQLVKHVMTLDAEQVSSAMINRDETLRPIWLHINSRGGYVLDGLAAMDQLDLSKCPVYTVVDGSAASAATLISIKGKRRYIKKNSFMLIHQVSSMMWGKYDEFVDEVQNLEKFMRLIKKIYIENTKIPAKYLDEILKRDLYFDAKECIKYGLADQIL